MSWPQWIIAFVLGFILSAMANSIAHSQTVTPHPNLDEKDPYTGKYNWDGELCCNGHDCLAAQIPQQFKPVAGGILIVPTGEVVPHGKQGISPDGSWHVCRLPDGKKGPVRCLLIPNGGV